MLSAEVEIFAFQAKLPQQLRQRPRANAWLYIVGKGVESDVKLPTVERVIGIEPAESVVFLYDKHVQVEIGQTDTCRQSRHARADDDHIVMHTFSLRIASRANDIKPERCNADARLDFWRMKCSDVPGRVRHERS